MNCKPTRKAPHPEPMATVREVASTLNASHRTVRQWAKDGVLPSVRLGGVLRFPRKRIKQIAQG
jgi:excisionase family DNA binding protein